MNQTNLAHIVCYQCGDTGHYARNCLARASTRTTTTSLIDFDQPVYEQPVEEDRVARLKAELGQMSNDEKERLACKLRGTLEEDLNQDFLNV
jgi:acyl-coenzyme A thioesterase PaaI-like protein